MPSLNTGNAILSNPIKVDSSYNVGIGGAASGSFKLQVTGTTNLTGALTGTTSAFTTRVDIGTRSSGNIRNLNIYGATNGNAIIKLDGADGNGYGAQIDFISKTSGGTSNNWTLGTGITGGTNAFELFNGTSTVFNLTTTGAATFSSSVTATAATFSDIVTNTTGGYRTLASQGYILRNDANNANLGGFTRRSVWTGTAALDTQIFAETGYGIFLNVNGSVTTGINILSSGNVGIGTANPDAFVTSSGFGTLVAGNGSGEKGITIYSGTTGRGGLMFADATSGSGAYIGYVLYNHSTDTMELATLSVPRLFIKSDGRTWVGGAMSGFDGSSAIFQINGFSRVQQMIFHNGANVAQQVSVSCNGAASFFIDGALSKNSGSFRIDHPLESMTETHQLVHSFVEAPQADLYYRGKLTLVNGKGQANIDEIATMTEGTFEALCREVQCFTTNETGWDLVKGKVIGNIIYIESQNTNSTDEISWLVIGERKDKHMMDTFWTDENGRVIVEPLKPIEEDNNK